MCVCSLRYPAFNANASYCHRYYVWGYSIFPHYLINGTTFEKKGIEHKKCFDFLLILPETFLILRIIERDMIKKYIELHVKYLLFLSDFNELEISCEIF